MPAGWRPCTTLFWLLRRRIAKLVMLHHTPKHGSWLSMVESEFGVLARACLRAWKADEDNLEMTIKHLRVKTQYCGGHHRPANHRQGRSTHKTPPLLVSS